MQWYSVNLILPGQFTGYVIARVLNADNCQFIYQALYRDGVWEFWDEEYWPSNREGFRVTHWTNMPKIGDGNGIGKKAYCRLFGHDWLCIVGQHHDDTLCKRCQMTRKELGEGFE